MPPNLLTKLASAATASEIESGLKLILSKFHLPLKFLMDGGKK